MFAVRVQADNEARGIPDKPSDTWVLAWLDPLTWLNRGRYVGGNSVQSPQRGVVAVKRPIVLATVAATGLLGLVGPTGAAQAEVPGTNGQIAFERQAPGGIDAPGQGTVFVANPDGTHAQQVPLVYPTDVDAPIDWSPDGTKLLLSHGPVR
jgi:hypothetical protein